MTALEWLKNELNERCDIIGNESSITDIFEQAKEMEKKQIIEAFEEGMFHHVNGMCPDEYYNEKFNLQA